jgi:septal ring factor EnvC (AmiA/AmiB activator)
VTPSDNEESNRLPSDSDAMLKRLRELMNKSTSTQQALQEFDKKRGLPRSHSQTMVNSSRSRRQIIQGKIIAKWDGSPLISDEHELGKPKPRVPKKKNTTEETIF